MGKVGQPLDERQQEETTEFGWCQRYQKHQKNAAEKRRAKKRKTMDAELEIIERILEWAGSRDDAYAWYRNHPIPAVGGQTAEAMVKLGHADVIHNYLDHLAVGGYA
jgi:hypothetical protein